MNDAAATCHPASGDTVYGVRGIVTGFDKDFSPYAFWIQTTQSPNAGIQVFTGASNYFNALPGTPTGGNLRLGDSVSVSGAYREFNNRSEIDGFDTSQSSNDHIVRRISSFNPVPAPIILTTATMNWIAPVAPANGIQEPYEGMLVKIRGPLKVGRSVGPGIGTRSFLVVTDPPTADSALVDGFSLTNVNAPPIGTAVDSVVGIVDDVTISGIRSYRHPASQLG